MISIGKTIGGAVGCEPSLEPVEQLVALIGEESFGSQFFSIADRLLNIDHCTAFISSERGPRAFLAEAKRAGTTKLVRDLATNYVGEAHSEDPVWSRFETMSRNDCTAFFLSPEDFSDRNYRNEFYVRPNVQQELALTGLLGNERVYLSFYRENGRAPFTAETLAKADLYGRLMLCIVQKHAQVAGAPGLTLQPDIGEPERRRVLLERVRKTLVRDSCGITPREAEICASIVLGYSVLGISLNLGISVNTVATHRKRAYAKLQISSQNELFARYHSIVEMAMNRNHLH